MRRVAVLLLFVVACRTTAPSGAPFAPLTATTSDDAMQQLRERRASFGGARSLMRVRVTANGKTQSFKAQLAVRDARRMELVAYTPVGTQAMKLVADGDRVTIDNKDADWFSLFGSSLLPAEMAMLILGIPPRDDLAYEVAPAGLISARVDDVTVAFDPAAFPAKHVVVTRGEDRVEIENLEVVR